MPMAVRPAPSMACGVYPSSRTRVSMVAWSCGVTSGWRTISIRPRYQRFWPIEGLRSQAIAGLQAHPGQKRRGGQPALSFQLQLDEPPDRSRAGDEDAVGAGLDDLARRLVGRLQDRLGGVDLEDFAAQVRPCARPGREAAAPLI